MVVSVIKISSAYKSHLVVTHVVINCTFEIPSNSYLVLMRVLAGFSIIKGFFLPWIVYLLLLRGAYGLVSFVQKFWWVIYCCSEAPMGCVRNLGST